MHAGLESFLAKVQTIRDSFTPYQGSNTKDLFQPYSPAPEKIKALTDRTKSLYEDLLGMKRNIVMERIKLREGKLLALVEHELKHYFGKPYENNYYTGMTCRCHSFIHSLIHLSIRPSVRPSVHPSIHPYIYLSIYPFIHPSINPFVRTSVHPSIHPSFRPSIHTSFHPSVRPSVRPSVHLFLRPSARPSASPSLLPPICPSVRPSIYPPICMFDCSSFPLSVCPFIPPSIDPSAYPLYVRSSVPYSLRFSVRTFSHTSVRTLLIGRAAWDIRFSQSEVLPRSVVIRNQYAISALVSQRSFRGETSRAVAKCRMFSQACSFLLPSQFFLSIIQKPRSMDARP